MPAGGNNGRNQAVTTAPKSKKSNNKRSHEDTKQNGPVEREETLAAAGASADAKESPPEKCHKTCDVQDTSYHGQDVADSETTVNKNQSHKGSNQHPAQKGGNQQHSQKKGNQQHSQKGGNQQKSHKGGDQQQRSKDSLPTQRNLVLFEFMHGRGHGRGRPLANSSQDERGRVVEKDRSHDATSSRKGDHSRSHDKSHDATSSRKGDHSRSHDKSHDATNSRKSDHSRSPDRSCDGAKGGVRDRSHSGSRHSSQGRDNQEKDWRYGKKEKQQVKWQSDKRSASQREEAQGGKKTQKEDIQNILEWLRREWPRGEPIELVEVKGDLFSCPETDAMAHCVSEDLAMGKGIAVRFKEAFRGVDDLTAQAKKVGDVATLYRDGNYVYYLITKKRYFCKPTYQTLKSSLTAMKNHMVEHKVTHLSMPTIGCGLDRLVWVIVADIIRRVFHGTGIKITIYRYDGK